MANSYIAIDEPSTVDKKLDTEQLTVGANTVERERVIISGTGATDLAPVSATDGVLVNLGANNDVTVTGTVTANIAAGTNNIGDVDVLTVPAPLNVTGGGVEASALRVTLASDSTGVVSVDDNGGSLTVDGSVAVTNAGTFATQVDGAALTALQLIDDPVATLGTTTYTEATTKGMIIGAVRRDADTTLVDTTNEVGPVQMNAAGQLKVEVFSGETLPVSLASTTITGTVTVASHAVTNAGTFAVQVDGSALTALQLIDDPVLADDAAFTPATSKVMMAGFEADETSTDSVDEGDAGAARMTLDRKLIVTVQPHTAGGWDTANMTSGDTFTALTNTAQAVKASAGKLGGWYIYNPNSTVAYVIVYNVASGSVTVGTTTPKLVLAIPATSAANLELVNGITFDTAIAVAATTTGGGSTAPSTALEANFWYK